MELFLGKQLEVVVYSFILGLIFGGLYDIIRIIHIMCGIASYTGEGRRKSGILPFFLFFLCDAVYMLIITATFSVFLYAQMSGTFRLFVLLSVLAGFAVWYATAGRLVMACSEAIVRFLRRTAYWMLWIPVRFLLGILRKIFVFLYRQTAGRILRTLRNRVRHHRSEFICRKLKKDLCFVSENKRKLS